MEPFRRQVDEHHPLIPGYTGYIPFRFYRVGSNYGSDSVWCVNEFRDLTRRHCDQQQELRYIAATTPQLPPICSREEIVNVLDDYNYKHHPNMVGPVKSRRSLLEPPIPGWTGFIPRSKVMGYGDGARYHVMAEQCYRDFKNSLDKVKHVPDAIEPMKEVQVAKPEVTRPTQRLYRPEGIMPKYTGHVPNERSGIGKTFGNVCRSCSVCFHHEDNYGTYLKKKRKAEKCKAFTQEEKKASTA